MTRRMNLIRSNYAQGNGCVVAHCMGLGKTFQAIAFIYALLNAPSVPAEGEGSGDDDEVEVEGGGEGAGAGEGGGGSGDGGGAVSGDDGEQYDVAGTTSTDDTKSKGKGSALADDDSAEAEAQISGSEASSLPTGVSGVRQVLVVCPVNVVENWDQEFTKWMAEMRTAPEMFVLTDAGASNKKRVDLLKKWKQTGGIMIIGYDNFRNLVTKKTKFVDDFKRYLCSPGPGAVVCDEGHIMKNANSGISKALSSIKTKLRIVLSGTPMQNNLMEYHTMISFVRPGLLSDRLTFKSNNTHCTRTHTRAHTCAHRHARVHRPDSNPDFTLPLSPNLGPTPC